VKDNDNKLEVNHMTQTIRLLAQAKKLEEFEREVIELLTSYDDIERVKEVISRESLTGPNDTPLTNPILKQTIEESIKQYFETSRLDLVHNLLLQFGFHKSTTHIPNLHAEDHFHRSYQPNTTIITPYDDPHS